jgi:LPXTG-motif cell wall-anchored protein
MDGGGSVSLSSLVEALKADDNAEAFVANVEKVQFSDPELVWIGKAESDTTVGELKKENGLKPEYNADLTEERITKADAQTVKAGDWALISLKPFDTEENLVVTMKNGDQFVVNVTDAQISANVLTADGEHFCITVTYDDEANIPEGSELVAEEISEGSEKYEKYLEETAEKWEQDNKKGYISFCRFFDIEIQKDGKKIEPETPVEVEIVHEDGLAFSEDESLSVIHFAENGTEIIDELQRNEDSTQIVYEQDGFSVIGTVSTVKDSGWPTNNGQHVLVLKDGNTYYALKHDGTLTKVRYFNGTVSFTGPGTTTTDYINDYLWYVSSNQGANAYGRVSDAPYSQGDDTTGINFICPTDTGWEVNAARQIRMDAGSHKLYYRYRNVDRTLSAENGELSVVPLNSENASPLYFANASTFIANSNETDFFTQEEVDSIISMWQSQMTKGFSTDKTAEAHDYENRVYRIDITASSANREISPSIALEFVVDASRSMFFPTSITEAGNLNGNNINAVTNWLNQHGDTNQTYFVISDPDGSATQYAFFYNPAETKHWYNQGGWKYYEGEPYATWEWVDASNYNPPDGAKVVGNIPDRFPYSNLDGKIYTTEIDDFTVTSEYGRRGNYVSRIEYLKQCVRVASQVIYSVDENAQIGLIGFNKNITDYGTYGKEQIATLLDRVNNISLDGQTNQEGGLAMAISKFQDPANAEKYNNHKHVVVLVTDGAPNYTYPGGHKVTWDTIGAVATQLKNMPDSFGNGTELYTMGLSLSNVGQNQSGLFNVSSGPGYQYSAENAMEIVDAVTKMIEGVFVQANLVGDVTDMIDPAFYPVDKASSSPLSDGDWIDIEGNKVDANNPNKVGKISREGDQWKVTWEDQSIDWPTMENGAVTEPGWHGTVFVKAKEDFLGGRGISTNTSGSQIIAKKWKEQGSDVLHDLSSGEHVTPLEVPYVNVDELDFTYNDTTWTVYLGTEVDPLKEVQALWNKVNVKEVVTKSDSDDHRMSADGELTYSYSQNASDNRTEVKGRNEFPITSIAGVDLTEDDWDDLIRGEIKYIDYSAYGHDQVGTISIRLDSTVKDNEADLTESPHETTVTGTEVEKYVLSVWYTPKSVSISDWHTGTYGTGSRGVNTGNIRRANSHTINVFVKGLQITKVDLNDQILPGAKFALYRSARDGETDLLEIDGKEYYKLAELDTSSTGIAVKDQTEQLKDGEQYYLVETQTPAGYDSISPIPVDLNISNLYTPKPGAVTQATKPETGIFDWTQNASLTLNAKSGVRQTNADNTEDLTHTGATTNSNTEIVYYRITNNPGVVLPHTGGIGTTIFYILGSILVIGGGIYFVSRRRMK